jgi:secernin
MGCDMVVALGGATVNGIGLFGTNHHGPVSVSPSLVLCPGREHALGETVPVANLPLPQARQTYTVLGSQLPQTWGYLHGVNEHRVAAGCAGWTSRLPCAEPAFSGPDLVRLTLERCRSARQAFDLLTSLIGRHGQRQACGPEGAAQGDQIFLVADAGEAYLVEAAGSSWASLECHEVRAVSDAGLIRQDWQRIAPGVAEHAISQGWWPDEGTKLDFNGSLGLSGPGKESSLRRWGRATFLLEQQSGRIDAAFLRRLLGDHYEGSNAEADPLLGAGPVPLCRHAGRTSPIATTASLVAPLGGDPGRVPMAWCAFGPPCSSVYLPIFLAGTLPEPLVAAEAGTDASRVWRRTHRLLEAVGSDPERWAYLRNSLSSLQARLDEEAEEFAAEAARLRQGPDKDMLGRQASLFMQNHLEQLEAEFQRLQTLGRPHTPVPAAHRVGSGEW